MATKLLFILLLINLFSTLKAQSPHSNNITKGSTLFTNSSPNFWPSHSGHFKFGFYPNGNGFKVGIWLVGSPTDTVVWTAGSRNAEISSGAALSFSANGSILLRSSNGEVQLIAEGDQGAVLASLLDSGNYVLYDSNLKVVWSSFSEDPTDTLLVGQKLAQGTSLFSSMSITNQSVGNFKLRMQNDGNLAAYPIRSMLEGKYAYWWSSTSAAGKNITLNLDHDGRLYLRNSTGFSIRNLTVGGLSVNSTVLYRATLDVDGIFRLYQHQIGTNGSLSSKILWEAIDKGNRCSVKGVCGVNSYCSQDSSDIACLCPPGFAYINPLRPQDGCKVNSVTENACIERMSKKSPRIDTLENTVWERDEYDIINPSTEESCSNACLEDCNCAVALFRPDQLCFKYKLPLRYGRKDTATQNNCNSK